MLNQECARRHTAKEFREGDWQSARVVVVCLGTNDVPNLKDKTPHSRLEEDIVSLLKLFAPRPVIVIAPLGFRNIGYIESAFDTVRKAEDSVSTLTPCVFCDASSIGPRLYGKDKAHLVPAGHVSLSRIALPYARNFLASGGCPERKIPTGIRNPGMICYQIATVQAMFHIPAIRSIALNGPATEENQASLRLIFRKLLGSRESGLYI